MREGFAITFGVTKIYVEARTLKKLSSLIYVRKKEMGRTVRVASANSSP